MRLFIILFCFVCLLVNLDYLLAKRVQFDKSNVAVTIDQGALIGRETKDYGNDTYYIFEAIPYAKPPVGALRFKAPEPPEPWSGVYDATKGRAACSQSPFNGVGPEIYSEDCLFVNVHTKMTDELKPVMVWIHGGAFNGGSIDLKDRGSQLLMVEDIVLVDIQYRLNIFGFLAIDDPKYGIPGNAGLKDQVMALRWIQKNIIHFGGDPNQVTIFGESAGGASVHLLYVSPLAKGLFHRAIAQSGSGANNFVYSPNQYPQVAEALGCDLSDLDQIVNCINSSTTDELLDVNANFGNTINILTFEDENSIDPFLTDTAEAHIKSGNFNKVPIIMGVCANESGFLENDLNFNPNFTEADYENLIPIDLNVTRGSMESINVGKQIKEFYYGDPVPSSDFLDSWIRYQSDITFNLKMNHIAKVQVETHPDIPLYFYMFNYLTKLNYQGTHANTTGNLVIHADDLQYLFYPNGEKITEWLDKTSDEFIGMRRMIKLWTTFAKSKNADPNPENDPLFSNVSWKPMEPTNWYYLHIRPELGLEKNIYDDRMTFWSNLYKKYGEIPVKY